MDKWHGLVSAGKGGSCMGYVRSNRRDWGSVDSIDHCVPHTSSIVGRSCAGAIANRRHTRTYIGGKRITLNFDEKG